jgi:signal transduction histidine kinase
VMMDLAWLQKRLRHDQPALLEKAQGMAALLNATIRSVRQITSDLRPGILDDLGLVPAIEWQLQEFETRSGIRTELRSEVTELVLPADSATAVFRVFQEILSNVARHAQATRVLVRLDIGAESASESPEAEAGGAPGTGVRLSVTDNGRGISTAELRDPNSLGLLSMRERVRQFGGNLTVKGTPGLGTTVVVTIPTNDE